VKLTPTPSDFNPRDLGCKCDSCPLQGQQPIKPTINRDAKLVVLGERPTRTDTMLGECFKGRPGDLFDKTLTRVGIPKEDLHLTNAVLCPGPVKGLSPSDSRLALECCAPRLEAELLQVGARWILGYGKSALQAITGKAKILDWMGAPLDGIANKKGGDYTGWKILPTLHPGFCLSNLPYTPVMQIHTIRAWDYAHERIPPWKWPEIVIEGSQVVEALRHILANPESLGVDVETTGINPRKDALIELGISGSELAVCVDWPNASELEQSLAAEILKSPRHKSTMHNGWTFDVPCLWVNGLSVPNYDYDTLIAHAIVAPLLKHKLSIVSCIEHHAPRWKDSFRAGGDEKGAARIVNAARKERADYCAKDCYMTLMNRSALDTRIDDTYRGREQFDEMMDLAMIAIKMSRRGVVVNRDAFNEHRRTLYIERQNPLQKLQEIARSVNFSHTTKKGGIINEYNPDNNHHTRPLFMEGLNVKPTKFSKLSNAPSFDAGVLTALQTHPRENVSEAARALLMYRKYNKLLSTYIDGLPIEESHA